MKVHLLKVALFCGIQAAILFALGSLRPESAASVSAVETPQLAERERLDAFLRERFFPLWTRDRNVLAAFAASPPTGQTVSAVARDFVNGPDNYMASLIDKDHLLKHAPGPRMIFLGGSGLAFGFDSQIIADRYDYTPINYGLNVGLGGNFMLQHVRDHLRRGDVVVLCFEYESLISGFNAPPDTRRLVGKFDRDLDRHFRQPYEPEQNGSRPSEATEKPFHMSEIATRLSEMKRYADSQALSDLAAYIRRSAATLESRLDPADEIVLRREFDAAFDELRERLIETVRRHPVVRTTAYRRSLFNRYGDYTGPVVSPERADTVDKSEWDKMESRASIPPDAAGRMKVNLGRLNMFANECRSKGVQVFFMYPPLFKSPHTEHFTAQLTAIVEEHLRMQPLFPVEDVVFDVDLFYDTRNHLTWEGTRRRMVAVATALDEHFEPRTHQSVVRQVAERDRAVRGRHPQLAAREPRPIY